MLVRFSEEGEAVETGVIEEEDILVKVKAEWEEREVLVGRKAKTPENPKFI